MNMNSNMIHSVAPVKRTHAVMLWAVFIFNILITHLCMASTETSFTSTGSLTFYLDVYEFEGTQQQTRLELVYGIDLADLQAVMHGTDSLYLDITIVLTGSDKNEISRISEKKVFEYDSAKVFTFIDLKRFEISPGKIHLHISVSDPERRLRGAIDEELDITGFPDVLSLSDPVFGSFLGSAGENSIFNRSGIFLLPNPGRTFRITNTEHLMYLFYEINHLDYSEKTPGFYAVSCDLDDLSGQNKISIRHDALKKVGPNTARIEKINIDSLESAVYLVRLNVSDPSSSRSYSIRKYIRVVNTRKPQQFILPMADDDVEKYLDQIRYIATDRELALYTKLDKFGKQQFLLNFWKSRDPDPETAENEFMEEHFRKLAYCEKSFNGGLKSDFARIYMKYGSPVDIERSFSNLGYSKPVEIWNFAMNGAIQFVFVDRTNDGKYVLVHSNHPDEYFNPDWAKAFNVSN